MLRRSHFAVQDGVERIADGEAVGGGEGFAEENFAALAGLDVTAFTEKEIVEHGSAALRDGDETAGGGLVEAGHVEGDVHEHARLNGGHTRDFRHGSHDRLGSALHMGEDIGEAKLRVIGGLRYFERKERRAHGHVGGDAAGEDQGDGEQLAAHVDQVANEFAMERSHGDHQESSAGAIFLTLR